MQLHPVAEVPSEDPEDSKGLLLFPLEAVGAKIPASVISGYGIRASTCGVVKILGLAAIPLSLCVPP